MIVKVNIALMGSETFRKSNLEMVFTVGQNGPTTKMIPCLLHLPRAIYRVHTTSTSSMISGSKNGTKEHVFRDNLSLSKIEAQ